MVLELFPLDDDDSPPFFAFSRQQNSEHFLKNQVNYDHKEVSKQEPGPRVYAQGLMQNVINDWAGGLIFGGLIFEGILK